MCSSAWRPQCLCRRQWRETFDYDPYLDSNFPPTHATARVPLILWPCFGSENYLYRVCYGLQRVYVPGRGVGATVGRKIGVNAYGNYIGVDLGRLS